jgi:hypothetical protein
MGSGRGAIELQNTLRGQGFQVLFAAKCHRRSFLAGLGGTLRIPEFAEVCFHPIAPGDFDCKLSPLMVLFVLVVLLRQ